MWLQLCETNPAQAAQSWLGAKITFFSSPFYIVFKLKLKLTLEAKFISRPRSKL